MEASPAISNGEDQESAPRRRTLGSNMLIDERRQYIMAQAQRDGRVLVDELSNHLGISRITIRKDLDFLQDRGALHRTHGGAMFPGNTVFADPSIQEKERRFSDEKRRIADAAAEMVKEGQCVLLDSGTTTTAVARALKRFARLTVVTNAVNIATELNSTDFEVLLTGGALRKNSLSLVGPLTEEMLHDIHADILFLGVDGFDLTGGLTTPNLMESRVNRAMMHAASKVVTVCDSSKFNRRSLSRIASCTAVHHVITDSGLPEETADAVRAAGIELTIV